MSLSRLPSVKCSVLNIDGVFFLRRLLFVTFLCLDFGAHVLEFGLLFYLFFTTLPYYLVLSSVILVFYINETKYYRPVVTNEGSIFVFSQNPGEVNSLIFISLKSILNTKISSTDSKQHQLSFRPNSITYLHLSLL